MAVRLRDVAERAGVSVKTASNVINDYPHIKPATRKRVEEAIRELRYRPNVSARQLKYGRAGFLALAVPQMDAPVLRRGRRQDQRRGHPAGLHPAARRDRGGPGGRAHWCWTAYGPTSSTG